MDLKTQYLRMDVSHLSIDEVEYELFIRKISYSLTEHESVKRRRLKDQLKQESDTNSPLIVRRSFWSTTTEELRLIFSKLITIGALLENPKLGARNKEKMKTRLVHFRVRISRLHSATDSHKFVSEIARLEKEINQICLNFFPLLAPIPEEDKVEDEISKVLEDVRTEIEDLNQSVMEIPSESEEAQSTTRHKLITEKEKELETSIKRTEEILDKLSEYEKGEVEDLPNLLKAFKDFVIQSSEQEKQRRLKEIELKQQKIKEDEKHLLNKMRLEKLLENLNQNLKVDSTKKDIPGVSSPIDPVESKKPEKKKISKSSSKNTKNSASEIASSFSESSHSVSDSEPVKKPTYLKNSKSSRSGQSRISHKSRSAKTKKKYKSSESELESERHKSSSSSSSMSSSSSTSSSDSFSEPRRHSRKKSAKIRSRSTRRVPISEWKLKYDGRDEGRKLSEFFKEIKMRARAEDVSDRELFRSAIHLFSGRARDWFLDGYENKEFRNWYQLKKELKREFLPPDLDFQLEIQATNRRQGRGEKFVDYFHEMQKIYHSMTKPISDRRKFDIIWRNMRHEYKNAMTGANIHSLHKLKRFGRTVDENNWYLYQKSAENQKSRNSQLNEISGFKEKSKKDQSGNNVSTRVFQNSKYNKFGKNESESDKPRKPEKEHPRRQENVPLNSMEGSSGGTFKNLVETYRRPPLGVCYNCRKPGHHYGECPDKRQKFCRLCGFSDVFTSLCPVCSKNVENSA